MTRAWHLQAVSLPSNMDLYLPRQKISFEGRKCLLLYQNLLPLHSVSIRKEMENNSLTQSEDGTQMPQLLITESHGNLDTEFIPCIRLQSKPQDSHE